MFGKKFFVYILTNKYNSVFYVGVTNDLARRILEHKNNLIEGFTKKYNVKKLVYYEECSRVEEAIMREKQLKNWHREWKMNLIKSINLDFAELGGDPETSSG